MSEPTITINEIRLTKAQAMTVRGALNAFSVDLQDGLGNDEHGKAMTEAYQNRLSEIFRMFS